MRSPATASTSCLTFAPFDFFARHKENEKEILRVYRTTATDVEAKRDDHA